MNKTILVGSDHAGFELKNKLVQFLKESGHTVEDLGAASLVPEDDYSKILAPLADKLSQAPEKFVGIVLGGSGQGEAIICNRFPHVRAVVYYGGPLEIIKLAREHNDANILS